MGFCILIDVVGGCTFHQSDMHEGQPSILCNLTEVYFQTLKILWLC